ncbi:MAG: hypothetical protein BroJett018_19650 [Chloroflexota bacterium]|nr:MAG: hypothetical protein BroJett018_19650 [Chloroflexota bacterium]
MFSTINISVKTLIRGIMESPFENSANWINDVVGECRKRFGYTLDSARWL